MKKARREARRGVGVVQVQAIRRDALRWFVANGRTFPWRRPNASQYEQVVTEVLLQRTRAETVSRFLGQFLERFPDWQSLASSSEQEISEVIAPIGLWRRRAAGLHRLAVALQEVGFQFPTDQQALEALPGVGQYVANAVRLFVFNEAVPLVDANMARVLERYFGPRDLADIRFDPYLQDLAAKVLVGPKPKEINWAILDLGALVCTVARPRCGTCPLAADCEMLRGEPGGRQAKPR